MFPAATFGEIHSEALLAAGYALALILIALALEHLAARSQRRAEGFQTTGFRYHPHLDRWECPTGELLQPVELDHVRRLARYRAEPAACNRCPIKAQCTDSDAGREITHPLAPWPYSEIARFHRGISLTLVALSIVVAALGLLRHHAGAETIVLGTGLVVAGITVQRLLPGFLAQREEES